MMSWRYVPFAGFFLCAVLVTFIRYLFNAGDAFPIHASWLVGTYLVLHFFWIIVRWTARLLNRVIPYDKKFSTRIFFQISLSLLLLVPPILLCYLLLKEYLPAFVSTQFLVLGWVLLFVVIVLMNTGLAAGIFFSSWQRSVQKAAKAEEEKRNTELELVLTKQRQAAIEMKALRAQMNPHFIFNSLNSINKYILKSDNINASRYLTRFAKLIRLILDNSNNREIALSDELEALRLYIEMELLRFATRFVYTIEVDENVCADSIQVPPLIIQPYVENAIWHGLLHKESGGILSISVRKTEAAMLICTIEDNGIGRARAKALKSKSATTNKSMGITLTEERIVMLNHFTSLNASVEIIDLENEQGEAAGTKVILSLPV